MQTMQTAGPDYVALIIEWDDETPTQVIERKRGGVPYALIQVTSVALAGIGALALAAWGIHRLHAAPAASVA